MAPEEQRHIIEIANKEALKQGLKLNEYDVSLDVGNIKSKSNIASIKKDSPDFAERLKVLDGRDYQAVLYMLKNRGKYTLGGVFWVFVDIRTNEVIVYYGEK